MKHIIISILLASIVTTFGQTNLPPSVTVNVRNVPLEDGSAVTYALLHIDGRQMGFEVPENMLMHQYGTRIAMEDKGMRDNAGISVGVFTPVAIEGGSIKDTYISAITNQYAGVHITTEFTLTAGGHPGSAFDATYYRFGQTYILRTVFVPVGGSIIQFQLTVVDSNFKKYKSIFNTVLVTFRDGQGGQVNIPKFSSKL